MAYRVKEIFYSLQGEGAQAGRAAVFCRMTGCNLWSGREEDRSKAVCRFCDTDFLGTDGENGGDYVSAAQLADTIASVWQGGEKNRYCIFTGGEPLLQVDEELIAAVKAKGFTVAVETNGTRKAPAGLDWICVSPKAGAPFVQTSGDELKVVVPQEGLDLAAYEVPGFTHYFVQPADGTNYPQNVKIAVQLCRSNPFWRLSVQVHKFLQIP